MNDVEKRSHDLAVAFAKNLHVDINKRLDESTLEFLLQSFMNDYQEAYDYFKANLK